MPGFDELSAELLSLREDHAQADAEWLQAVGEVKRLDANIAALERLVAADDAELTGLRQERLDARAGVTVAAERKQSAWRGERELLEAFAEVADPRDGAARLDAAVPMLLLPLRL